MSKTNRVCDSRHSLAVKLPGAWMIPTAGSIGKQDPWIIDARLTGFPLGQSGRQAGSGRAPAVRRLTRRQGVHGWAGGDGWEDEG